MIAKMALVLIVVFGFFPIESVREKVYESVVNMAAENLEREEAKNVLRAKNHEVVTGKDTAYVWAGHFEILNSPGGPDLTFELEDGEGVLLENISRTDVYDGMLYVIADTGYAVVDRDCNCRVVLKDFGGDYEASGSRFIKYLEDRSEFSEAEQKHFAKMEKKKPAFE